MLLTGKKIAWIVLAATMLPISLKAQSTLTGFVNDQKNQEPVPFATVALMDRDSNIVAGDVTNTEGQYAVKLTQRGKYIMRVSFVGYQTHYQDVDCNAAKLQLPAVSLLPDAQALSEVVVTAKRPLVEQQIDKLVMNVAQSAMANGNNALDLLRKAPGVSVDKDGNVKLNGQAVQVWIDGRPSQLDGKALEALLRSTDGSTIDKFEIMANPSAKYDAEGQGGIINIKTKRNFKQGLNGTLSASYGGMYFGREHNQPAVEYRDLSEYLQDQGVDLNLSYRTAKTNTFLQVGESTNQMGVDVDVTTTMNTPELALWQRSSTVYDINTSNILLKVGNDWFIDDKNTLGVIFSTPFTHMNQWADTNRNASLQTLNDICSQAAISDVETDWRLRQYSTNLNFTHVFDPMKASEITFNADYYHNNTNSTNFQKNYWLDPLTMARLGDYSLMNLKANNNVDIYSAKADWQRVMWGKYMMEAGAKWATSVTNNRMDIHNGVFATSDPALNSTYDSTMYAYTEHVGALYASLARQFNAHWTAKAGLRVEYTNCSNNTNTVNRSYVDPFPTLFVGYTPTQDWRFNLSYTRRISRPNYDQLNPFKNYLDAYTSNEGNPNLRPNYIDNLNFIVGYGQHLSLTFSYNYMKDVITKVPIIDPATGNQNLLWDNFGLNTMASATFTAVEVPLSQHLTWMLNLSGCTYNSYADETQSLILGTASSAEAYEQHSIFGQGYTSLTLRLPHDWRVELDGWVSNPVTAGYLHTGWNSMVNCGIKKTCLDNRLTFNLNVNDIFRTMNGNFEVVGAQGAASTCTQRIYIQKVSLGLQWNFGTAQRPLKHRNVGNLDEASRTGNSAGFNSK